MFPWEMEVDGESSGAQGKTDDPTVLQENYGFKNESCGICGDIVIDRGVLDCCQHWFCYTCIDNWAAITNRCPLCKSEFQHITSTPVYGTIGAIDEDEYSLTSCDDDWYLQEESSTLSFPSYYIDAEAVVCLDDGDCKIRSGLVAAEDDSTLDTSIACDCCDKWYHAICVGFNPEVTSENSWLCPRCVSSEVKHTADVILKQNLSEECVIGSDRTSTDASFSGRVSVSVADEGETALVVSMVSVQSETRSDLSEASLGLKTTHEAFNYSPYSSHSKDAFTHSTAADSSTLRNTDSFSISQNKSSEMNIVRTLYSEPTEMSLQFSPIREPAATILSTEQGNMSDEQLEVPKLVSCPVIGNSKEAKNTGEDNAAQRSNDARPPVIKSPQPSSPVQQMKTAQNMQPPPRHDGHESNSMKEEKDLESGSEVSHPAKKAKLEVHEQDTNLIGNAVFSSTHSHTTNSVKDTVDDMSEFLAQHKSVPDIMNIVEGEAYIRDPGRELAKPVGRRAGDKPGLRVKKIFRKEEGKQSSAMVQKLQKEIREVVRDTGTNILEKDGSFDEKLLTAFRAAIGKSADGTAKNTNQLIRTRRSLLQKGKKRENLTKKLYGTSTGRRRSDWHRDWEVEFWKYRCSPGTNPEKIETLQSVLQLLKRSSEMDKESAQGKKGESNNSILSRLYLADASVVPRKDDIRPLSALEGCAPLDKSSQIRANNSKSPNIPAAGIDATKISSPSSTGKISSSSTLNKEASSRRENRNSQPSMDKKNHSSGDVKEDKRKWALEILARKNASSVTSKDQTGDNDALKGNFPLLAQLPVDMRPKLAAGRNNKVPISVRQAQLHRIAEHYLQKANLDVIRRCADTELAIADAVNVEKDIYERSSSKSIYVNLCSQASRQPAKEKSDKDTSTLTKKAELGSDLISQKVTSENTNVSGSDMEDALHRAVVSDLESELGNVIASEQTVHKHTVSFSSAEEALRKAGLFDSPPNSPEREITSVEGECRLEERSKNLQSYHNYGVKNVSSLKDDISSLPNDLDAANCQNLNTVSCQQPQPNSEEQQKLAAQEEAEDVTANKTNAMNLAETDRCSEQCEKSSGPGSEISVDRNMPDRVAGNAETSRDVEKAASSLPNQPREDGLSRDGEVIRNPKNLEPTKEKSSSDKPSLNSKRPKGDKPTHIAEGGDDPKKQAPDPASNNTPDASSSTYKKVEMFVKEHIRPLCKSGVISVDQYRWAVAKTTDKVMSFHHDAKNASFLIKEGDKVKKLALQYVEAAQQKIN
ncbi:hypothetical protein PAHAL_5G178700 [Panicum hallii]|uniref:RING-type domain-containing protein n=1 Tax=Panicum hallii TaxID=206008 RepID=A0A2S3HS96_9POAL|nr:hypothetical protein PAHAL_5G178700 [Panicum hallii]